jgi:hypothetical protein
MIINKLHIRKIYSKIIVYDYRGNQIYYEDSIGYWIETKNIIEENQIYFI